MFRRKYIDKAMHLWILLRSRGEYNDENGWRKYHQCGKRSLTLRGRMAHYMSAVDIGRCLFHRIIPFANDRWKWSACTDSSSGDVNSGKADYTRMLIFFAAVYLSLVDKHAEMWGINGDCFFVGHDRMRIVSSAKQVSVFLTRALCRKTTSACH